MDGAAVLHALPHAVVVVDDAYVLTYANEAAVQLVDDGPLLGRSCLDLVPEALREQVGGHLAGVRDQPGRALRLRLRAHPHRELRVSGSPDPSGPGLVLAMQEVPADAPRPDPAPSRRSERRFRAAFDATAHGSALVTERGRVVEANQALADLLGQPREALVGGLVAELVEPPGPGSPPWSQLGTVPRRLRHAGGGLVHVVVTTTAVEGDEGEGLVLVDVLDVTERRRSEQRLRHLALHDQLTDLPARALLLEYLRRALEARSAEAPLVAALFVDLDQFKLVNDALGHAAGDLVLRETARRLRQVTRPQDSVARLSGDEFVVVCPALTREDEAVAIADRLSAALRPPVLIDGDEILVSASIGVAFAPPDSDSAEDLLRDADTAMYRAKQLGRRRYEVFDSALRERAVERGRLRALLARALQDDRLVVQYQPVLDLPTRQVVGLEALVRLRDDDGTLLLPAEFLDVAQDSGLLPGIDRTVLHSAATAVAGWSQACGQPLGLSVNLCPGQVVDGLAGTVGTVLRGAGLPPDRLLIEVTEQTLAVVGPVAEDVLRELRGVGVHVALDDFGTGWSSLTRLRRLPLSLVKIDLPLVAALPGDPDGMLRAVAQLAERLGLPAAAEGVETPEQHAALLEWGIPYAQGRLFGGPVDGDDVPGLLAALGVHVPAGWPDQRPAPGDRSG